MKNYSIFLISLFSILISGTVLADIDISLTPTPVVAGEPATLSIRSTEGRPSIENLPDVKNLKWLSKNQEETSVIILNGKRFEMESYQFTADSPGNIIIPALKIKVGDKTIETQPKEIAATKGALTDIEKYIFLEPKYGITTDTVYAGQEIPLEIYLYKASQFNSRPIEYPQVKLDNVMYGNFHGINKENDSFAPYPYYQPAREEKAGIEYVKTCFYTDIIPMFAGKLNGAVSLMLEVIIPGRQTRNTGFDNGFLNLPFSFGNDPFFGSNKRVNKLITAKLPELTVLSLPAIPEHVDFIGLFGKWDIKINASTDKLKEGETLTITANIEGSGHLDALKVPQLSVPGFTIYPPEVKKYDAGTGAGNNQKSRAVVTYMLIPTEPGKNNISMTFAVFDPVSGKYDLTPFTMTVEVEKNTAASGSSYLAGKTPDNTNEEITAVKNEKKQQLTATILYLKKNIPADVEIPLWENNLALIIFFFLAGPILFLAYEIIRFRRSKVNANDSSRRKYKAEKEKSTVLKKLKRKKTSELLDFINSDVVKLINDLSGYPPGTTASELEKSIQNKELAECLKTAHSLSYMPERANNDGKVLKDRIYKALKKSSVIAIVFLAISGTKSFGNTISPVEQFASEYNSSEFKKAESICLNNINKQKPNPAWLYNLGECYYQEGDMTRAMVCFQRSLLLSPRDSDALQNLNYVRNKLFLPELYAAKTPLELVVYLRDMFRPDEWLLVLSVAVFFIFTALILRRMLIHNIVWISILAASTVISVISLTSFIHQSSTLYSGLNAIIVERDVEVYSLPSGDSQKSTAALHPGDPVKIDDTMGSWILIRDDDKAAGWVKSSAIEKIWPYEG